MAPLRERWGWLVTACGVAAKRSNGNLNGYVRTGVTNMCLVQLVASGVELLLASFLDGGGRPRDRRLVKLLLRRVAAEAAVVVSHQLPPRLQLRHGCNYATLPPPTLVQTHPRGCRLRGPLLLRGRPRRRATAGLQHPAACGRLHTRRTVRARSRWRGTQLLCWGKYNE